VVVVVLLVSAVAILSLVVAILLVQLRARDPDSRRRNPLLLRALTPHELSVVALGDAANSNVTGQVGGAWAEMKTTESQRRECAALYGLGPTLEQCAAELGVTLVRDPRARGRFGIVLDEDELTFAPGREDDAMVVLCGEALDRSDVAYTSADAQALADELAARRVARKTR
jgi:hypothetical protein